MTAPGAPGAHVSDRWRVWRERVDLDEYDRRWDLLEAEGADIHGEADHVMAHVGELGGRRVLDAGCGMGRIAIELAGRGCDVVGTDLDDDLLAFARRRAPELTWIHADLAALDLATDPAGALAGPFDVVLMAGNVVNFCRPDDRAAIVRGLAARVRPGGRIVAGFNVEREGGATTLDAYRSAVASARLRRHAEFATWGREPFRAGGTYVVCVDVVP